MIEFAVTVQGQRISCTKVKGELVSGAIGAKVRFTWSEEWQQLQRIGVFRAGSIARDVMDLQDECVIPWEVLVQPGQVLMIGVQGVNEEGTAVTPTLEAEMDEILRGADPSDDPSTEPSLPIWKWVKNLLEQVVKKVTKFMGDSDAALDAIIEMQEELLNGFGTLSAADLQQHIENNSNPHGVTPAQIGAAPAGYGLGEETAAYVSDVHTINKIGFYRFDSATANKPEDFHHGVISANIANGVIYLTATYAELQARSYYGDAGWGEWEYINALMTAGVEYRTIERWLGRVVYTKIVNVGAFPAEGSCVHFGLFDTPIARILRVNGAFGNRGVPVPYVDTEAAIHISGTVYEGSPYVVLYVEKGDFTDDTCIAQVWYVKD